MTTPDPYAVLGVSRSATDEEVRAAYRNRSMLLHPDLHDGRPEGVRREADRAMGQLTDAYRTVTAERAASPSGAAARAAAGRRPESGRAPAESALHRLGRAAARSRVARLATEASERDGGFAYRLGWLVGRRRST